MKCQFVLDVDMNVATLDSEQAHKLKFRWARQGRENIKVGYFPAGTEYEHPDADFFVRNGQADPADQECIDAIGAITSEQRELVKKRYRRLAAGIAQEDFALFDAGVILGYNAGDGSYVPGPNWDEYHRENPAVTQPDNDI
jgi:hypothetical protein